MMMFAIIRFAPDIFAAWLLVCFKPAETDTGRSGQAIDPYFFERFQHL